MNPGQQIQLTFGITECKCLSFEFSEFGINNKESIQSDKYEFLFNFQFNFSEEEKNATIQIDSTFFDNRNPGDKIIIAKLTSSNKFNIVNFSEVITKNANGFNFPDQVIIAFISISISNLRGMYAVKLENTLYKDAVIPVIDASNVIPKQSSAFG